MQSPRGRAYEGGRRRWRLFPEGLGLRHLPSHCSKRRCQELVHIFLGRLRWRQEQVQNVDGGDGSFFLQNAANGNCLHTQQATASEGSKVLWWNNCTGDKNKFKMKFLSGAAPTPKPVALTMTFVETKLGTHECPVGTERISDAAECKQGGEALGHSMIADVLEGPKAVTCVYCGGCAPKGAMRSANFGARASFICAKRNDAEVLTWKKLAGKHCGGANKKWGESIETWADGSSTGYGTARGGVEACQELCAVRAECHGFVYERSGRSSETAKAHRG
eukprot:TRINITY_DN585_c0_g1_i1.p1 TRINITY_DN585_c0_g1~~TRINITY_DN585_c0_g1_i1.p1  ORF type:complete len:287 (+),score=49.95 TRINITY_DN585_c0_g1_i1:33-863(+)